MAITQANSPYQRIIEYRYVAEWRSIEIRPRQVPAAAPFGPPFQIQPEELIPDRGYRSPKEVLYLPVKKQKGEETIPSVGIYVSLHEANGLHNVSVTAHRGAKVKITV